MTRASSPFDDPDLPKVLRRSGVKHQPGMASEPMGELAPLLAADGYSMQDPNAEIGVEELHASMSQTIERHNMELVVPVGDACSLTINTLREIAKAYEAGTQALIDKLFAKLPRESTSQYPSFSHIIGVALETLDAWYSDRSLRAPMRRLPIHGVPPEVTSVMSDVERFACKGRAFRSIERLLLQHNDAIVAKAGAYLVAASVAAVAAHDDQTMKVALNTMLPGAELNPAFGSGAAFGAVAAQQVRFHDNSKRFRRWLEENEGTTQSFVDDIEIFDDLVQIAARQHLDLFDPDDLHDLIDVILDFEDESAVSWFLTVLYDYLHFRLETGDEIEWEEPHEIMLEVLDSAPDVPPHIQTILNRLEDITAEDRYAAVMTTPLIAGISELVEWVGTARPVTGTGFPKRVDIGTVAAMLGIAAQGVAMSPPLEVAGQLSWELSQPSAPQHTRQVLSAKDIPELRSWWAALRVQAVIELTATKNCSWSSFGTLG